MNLWKYPNKIWQYPLFAIGVILFHLLIPVWFLYSKYRWKENSAFVLVHIEALFYNPWHLWIVVVQLFERNKK